MGTNVHSLKVQHIITKKYYINIYKGIMSSSVVSIYNMNTYFCTVNVLLKFCFKTKKALQSKIF